MLSTLPKLADRGFVLGFFLPSLLFVLAVLGLFSSHAKVGALLSGLVEKDLGSATFLLVGVWILAVLMLMLNHPIYRLLEGYTWPVSRWRRAKKRNQQRLQEANKKLRSLFERMRPPEASEKALWAYGELRREIIRELPTSEREVLPTAFGNAIKAFEIYPLDVYGVDAVPMWLRLVTVIPKGFQDQIQDLRNQVDFLVNASVFAIGVAVAALAAALMRMPWAGLLDRSGPWPVIGMYPWIELVVIGVALMLSRGFYRSAVARVPAWGDLVMAAFDCYLPALATQLGYTLPVTTKKRRAFWTAFGHMVVYRQDLEGTLPFLAEKWPKAAAAVPAPGVGDSDAAGRSSKDPKLTAVETEETDEEPDDETTKEE